MAPIKIKYVSLVFGFILVASFYYLLQWSSEIPILGGDHAIYLLMADHWSPFGELSPETTHRAMEYSYFPPLYPLILSLFGGTIKHIELAHMVTVTFFVAAIMFYFMWARRETGSLIQGFLLSAIFAFLPTTFFLSFGILSENLYLLLTLIAIWFLTQSRISAPELYIASVVIGMSVLARTVGIALIISFVIYLFIHHRSRWVSLTILSLAPLLLWRSLKWMLGYDFEIGYLWMISNFLSTMSPTEMFFGLLINNVHGIWSGWVRSFNLTPSLVTIITASLIGGICVAGCLHRIYQKKFDGIYVAIYFGVIVLWLSSEDAIRYLYVVVPILLLYGLQMAHYFVHHLVLKPVVSYVYLAFVLFTALPTISLLAKRFEIGTERQNKQYAKSLYWYSTQDLDRARLKIKAYKKFIVAWQRTSTVVRKDECVYSTDPTWFMLYSDRIAYSVPWVSTKDEFNKRANSCRYAYVGSYIRSPFPSFYPKEYIINDGKVVFVDRMEEMEGQPILGMLIEKATAKER